jgi:hypothetical protein
MNVLENYKVKFLISEDIGCNISTSNELLSAYIWEHLYVEIAQDLLDDITDVLNGTINLAGGPANVFIAV